MLNDIKDFVMGGLLGAIIAAIVIGTYGFQIGVYKL